MPCRPVEVVHTVDIYLGGDKTTSVVGQAKTTAGSLTLPTSPLDTMHRDALIAWYFDLGYSYPLIICFLYYIHGINLGLRQPKRILKRLNLKRKKVLTPALCSQAIAVIKVFWYNYRLLLPR